MFVRGEQALHQRQLRVAAQRPRLLHRLGLRRPYDHLRHHVAPQLVREGIALHHVVQRLDRLPLRRDVPVGHRVGHVVSEDNALAVRFRQRADHPPRVPALCQHAIQLILARALDLVIPSLEQRVRRLADGLRLVHANFRACFIRALPASLFEGGVSGADGRSCHPFRKAHPALRDDPLFRGHLNGALHLRRFAVRLARRREARRGRCRHRLGNNPALCLCLRGAFGLFLFLLLGHFPGQSAPKSRLLLFLPVFLGRARFVFRLGGCAFCAGGRRFPARDARVGLVQRRRQLAFRIVGVGAFLDLLPRLEVGRRVFLVVLSVAVESARVVLCTVPVFFCGQVRAFQECAHAVRIFAVESAALGLRQRLKRFCRPRAQRVVRNGVDAANHRRRVRRVGVDALPVKAHQGHFGQLQHGRLSGLLRLNLLEPLLFVFRPRVGVYAARDRRIRHLAHRANRRRVLLVVRAFLLLHMGDVFVQKAVAFRLVRNPARHARRALVGLLVQIDHKRRGLHLLLAGRAQALLCRLVRPRRFLFGLPTLRFSLVKPSCHVLLLI